MLKNGTFVRFNANGGSTGKIVGHHKVVKDFYYVEWVYGLDVKGEVICSTSGGINENQLIVITEEEYNKKKDGTAFSKT